jgi:hypothetical protein
VVFGGDIAFLHGLDPDRTSLGSQSVQTYITTDGGNPGKNKSCLLAAKSVYADRSGEQF